MDSGDFAREQPATDGRLVQVLQAEIEYHRKHVENGSYIQLALSNIPARAKTSLAGVVSEINRNRGDIAPNPGAILRLAEPRQKLPTAEPALPLEPSSQLYPDADYWRQFKPK